MLTHDEIIDVRDALIAKGDIASLSVADQNLVSRLQHCSRRRALQAGDARTSARSRVARGGSTLMSTESLRWVSWTQHGDDEHEPDSRPVAWPPPKEVLGFWDTGSGGGDGADAYCTVVALVDAKSEAAAIAVIEKAWSPGIGEWRFNREYGKPTPPNNRFPPPTK